MADNMPDYKVEQQRLNVLIAQFAMKEEQYKLDLMELVSRRKRILENRETDRANLKEAQARLRDLAKAHGAIGDADVQAALNADLESD